MGIGVLLFLLVLNVSLVKRWLKPHVHNMRTYLYWLLIVSAGHFTPLELNYESSVMLLNIQLEKW